MICSGKLKTFFASPEKADEVELQQQIERFNRNEHLTRILNLVPLQIVVLNSCRQIIFANRSIIEELNLANEPLLGRRTGELFHCSHVSSSGCGTSKFCAYCGIVNAVLDSMKSGQVIKREGTVTGKNFQVYSLAVTASQYEISAGDTYTILMMQDISDIHRRTMLERIFFHDMLNMVTTVSAMAELEKNYPEGDKRELVNFISRMSDNMMEEINAQRDLLAAEDGSLHADPVKIHSEDLVYSVVYFFEKHFAEQGKKIKIAEENNDVLFVSDPRLLRRVLVNMVKNALEAIQMGETVNVWARQNGELVEFRVHNPGFIPEEIQMRLFGRTFSTKGEGRGVGTYSMRLLSEKYLRGHISFASTKDEGTTFIASYPLG